MFHIKWAAVSLGLLLSLSCNVLGFNRILYEEFGLNNRERTWFEIGSQVPYLGKPEFKATQDDEGSTVYFGYGNNRYIRFRINERNPLDSTLDFNLFRLKGSFKREENVEGSGSSSNSGDYGRCSSSQFRCDNGGCISQSYIRDGDNDCGDRSDERYGASGRGSPVRRRSNSGDDDSVVIEGTLVEEVPCSICNMKMRMKVTPKKRYDDPVAIEVSVSSDGFSHDRIHFPSAVVRGVEKLEATLKIVIPNARYPSMSVTNTVEADFTLKIKSNEIRSSGESEYTPGNYTFSTSFEIQDPQRNGNLGGKVTIDENKQFADNRLTVKTNARNFKAAYRLSVKGSRYMSGKVFEGKITELNTDVTYYKVQAQFPDKDNFRIELSSDGIWAPYPQTWALNLNTTATTSEIYFETNDQCNVVSSNDYYDYPRLSSRRYPPPPRYPSYGDYGNYNETSEEEVENNSTANATLPHLSDFIGWNVQESGEVEDCNKWKIWDTEFDNGRGITRIYRDLLIWLFTGSSSRIRREKERGQIFEENIVVENDGYEINKTFSNGYLGLAISANVEKERGITSIQLTSKNGYGYPFATVGPPLVEEPLASFGMKIDESQSEKYKAKLRVINEKIFDAWFYDALGMNRNIKNLVNIHIPRYLNTKSATLTNFILADISNKFQSYAHYFNYY